MQWHKILLVGLFSFALLSGCARFYSKKDVIYITPLMKNKNQFIPNQLWGISIGKGIGKFYSYLRPSYQNSIVFAGDRYGIVKAIDTQRGTEKWTVDLSEYTGVFSSRRSAMLSGGIVVSGNKIYFGSERAMVYALNVSDGNIVWKTRVPGEVLSLPLIRDGMVLIHTSNGQLQALNASDGSIKWTAYLDIPSLSLRGESALAADFDVAIVGGDNGYVSAVSLHKGQIIWQKHIFNPRGTSDIDRLNDIDTTPVIVDHIVYVIGFHGNLTAMDLHSGKILWKRELGSVKDCVIDMDRIYLVDHHDRLVALRTKDGMTIWIQNDLLNRQFTSPVIFKNYLVTGDATGHLYWINIKDGHFIAQHLVDISGFFSTPLVAEDKLIIQARNGKVYAFTN